MKTVCVVQARLGSVRYPRKVLADLNSRSIVQCVIDQAIQIGGVYGPVVLAVPESDEVEFIHRTSGAFVIGYRGDEADVLGRFLAVARYSKADACLRITADCPVLNPIVAGQVLSLFHASQPCDFASNDTLISGYPDGWDVEVFSRATLETAAAKATDPSDREHVTSFMRRNFRCVTLMASTMRAWPKLSVDTIEDLERIRRIIRLQSELNIGLSEAVDEDARRTLLEQG